MRVLAKPKVFGKNAAYDLKNMARFDRMTFAGQCNPVSTSSAGSWDPWNYEHFHLPRHNQLHRGTPDTRGGFGTNLLNISILFQVVIRLRVHFVQLEQEKHNPGVFFGKPGMEMQNRRRLSRLDAGLMEPDESTYPNHRWLPCNHLINARVWIRGITGCLLTSLRSQFGHWPIKASHIWNTPSPLTNVNPIRPHLNDSI